MTTTTRRGFLELALKGFMVVGAGSLMGFSLNKLFANQTADWAADWDLTVVNQLVPGQSVDLNHTLPKQVRPGGHFSVASGARLPEGMSLTREGVLTVGLDVHGTVAGVVFSYDEPNFVEG